jgi:hypothetical protein
MCGTSYPVSLFHVLLPSVEMNFTVKLKTDDPMVYNCGQISGNAATAGCSTSGGSNVIHDVL